MERNERTILRIRCSKKNYRRFKRLSVDFDDYEQTLEALLMLHEQYGTPLMDVETGLSKYKVTKPMET